MSWCCMRTVGSVFVIMLVIVRPASEVKWVQVQESWWHENDRKKKEYMRKRSCPQKQHTLLAESGDTMRHTFPLNGWMVHAYLVDLEYT